ncbi:ABC transporter ATP-binding protein [Nonomuraea sp. NPDC050680]|uniref:ABC transporter ATP-binding protein n=1 Tax=Nonomuraea sp. NPDC050680 TaxID=3154630 RepID=UPI0033D15BE0
MGFLMDGLEAEDYDRTYTDRELLRRVVGYFWPKRWTMLGVASMIVLGSLTQAAVPVMISWGIDRIVHGGGIWTLAGGILLAGGLGWVFNFVRQWLNAKATGDVVLTLREDAFDAVLERDLSFYDENPSGRIVSRVTSDTDDFASVVGLSMDLLSQVLVVGFVTALLFTRNVPLALLTLLIVPIVVGCALRFRKIARSTTRRAQRSMSRVNANLTETMGGIAVAKNFRQEQRVYDEFRPINEQSYAVQLRQGFTFASIFPLLFLVAGLAEVMLVLAGGNAVRDGGLSAGDWYLFLQAVAFFWFPLTSIAAFWSQFQQGLSAAERVFALIDATPRVVQTDALPVGRLAGRIEFRDVSFGYSTETPVLENFNLSIEAGETVALVGHTGAGKSTLSKLITRFYEFSGGTLLIDDRDIRSLDLAAYRRQIGAVPQAPFLFSGTVADNIRYPRPEASDDEVLEAAIGVGGGDWIEALPDGLATDVGEHGRSLSMGQRQLVALARLLVQDPAVVVLDEATASVDPLTEAQIQEGLDAVLAGRTSIVIAHRLSTIEHVDRIVVLDHGRIVEQGDHTSLLARGGRYCEVYNTYFRHQSPDYRPGTGFVAVTT